MCAQNRVTEHDGEDIISEYEWKELQYDEISVRIPIWMSAKSKQCRVDFKVRDTSSPPPRRQRLPARPRRPRHERRRRRPQGNWLTIWAPPTEAVVGDCPSDSPPSEPLLDFQLHGAVDPDECLWELEQDGALRILCLTLKKSPAYKWPTLHRENGLKSEAERKPKLEAQRREFEKKDAAERKAAEKAKAEQAKADAEAEREARGPGPWAKTTFGPEEGPRRRPHRPKGAKDEGRKPGAYERGRIIVSEPPDFTDSSDDEEPEPAVPHSALERERINVRMAGDDAELAG